MQPVSPCARSVRMDELLSRSQIAARLGVSVSTVKRLERTPGWPPCVRVSVRSPRWRASDLARWVATRPGRAVEVPLVLAEDLRPRPRQVA